MASLTLWAGPKNYEKPLKTEYGKQDVRPVSIVGSERPPLDTVTIDSDDSSSGNDNFSFRVLSEFEKALDEVVTASLPDGYGRDPYTAAAMSVFQQVFTENSGNQRNFFQRGLDKISTVLKLKSPYEQPKNNLAVAFLQAGTATPEKPEDSPNFKAKQYTAKGFCRIQGHVTQ